MQAVIEQNFSQSNFYLNEFMQLNKAFLKEIDNIKESKERKNAIKKM
jgi:hypothetical protein